MVEFGVEWLWPKKDTTYEALIDEPECPVDYATVFSRLTFSWMTPLMKHGYAQYLTEEDLWGLAKSDTTKATGGAFAKSWDHELNHRKKPSLWLALFRAYGGPYILAAVFKIGNDLSAFAQPQLLRFLISFIDSYRDGQEHQPVIKGIATVSYTHLTLPTMAVV